MAAVGGAAIAAPTAPIAAVPVRWAWRDGSRPPKGLSADQVGQLVAQLPEASPKELLKASQVPWHPLHNELWSEGDAVWAERGRLARCHAIITSLMVFKVDKQNKPVETRAFTYVEKRWRHVDEVLRDQNLMKAYLRDVHRMLLQAAAKLDQIQRLT